MIWRRQVCLVLNSSHSFLLKKNVFNHLKLTSHGILIYLWSAYLSKSFSQLIVPIFKLNVSIYWSFFNNFFNRFCPEEKCVATPHCLYRDWLTLSTTSKTLAILKASVLVLFSHSSTWVQIIIRYGTQSSVACGN